MVDDSILLVGRFIERLMVVSGGGLSLAFGWHLFKIGVVTDQRAELAKKDIRVQFEKVGPGVFFALFGAVILIISLCRPLVFSERTRSDHRRTEELKTITYFTAENEHEILQHVKALNSQLQLITHEGFSNPAQPIRQADRDDLLKTMPTIVHLRNYIVSQKFGLGALQVWTQYGHEFLMDPAEVPQRHRDLLSEMEAWMKGTL